MPTDPTTPSARIPIVRMVSGSNGHPHSRKYEAVAHALIDKRDFEYLSKFVWTLVPHPTGMLYGRRSIWANKKSSFRSMQLEVWEHHHDPIAKGMSIDHHNRNGLDNRLENLRPATTAQQGFNKAAPAHTQTGYKGVHWFASARRFKSFIRFMDGSRRMRFYLGSYHLADEAATAYNHAAERLHGEFAWLNPIPEGAVTAERSAQILAIVLDRLTKPVSAE